MNVIELLEHYGVEYVESGPNVAKGNVNVQCPWCGDADRSHHCGIQLESGLYGCWRDKKHRGRSFAALLSKLTGISRLEARRQTGEGSSIAIQPSDLENVAEGRRIGHIETVTAAQTGKIHLPREFRQFVYPRAGTYRAEQMFRYYLIEERKFNRRAIGRLTKQYGLRYCVAGRFSDRLIIPVYEHGELMTYLGRSIQKGASLRYLALDKEESIKQVKDCVYNYDDALNGGEVLVIVEGALDAMKIDFYGQRIGVRSIGLFNMNVEDSQIDLLYNLRSRFDRYIILLDAGQVAESMELHAELYFFNGVGIEDYLEVRFMDESLGFSDPADLTAKEARQLAGSFLS